MRIPTGIALSLTLLASSATAQALGDPISGEALFKKCASCHQVGEDATNRVGPVLTNVLGRVAGTYPDYRYGDDMVAAGVAGLVWNAELVFDYIENPRDFLREYLDDNRARAKMSFRLRDEQDRLDVIAYLGTFEMASSEAEVCVVNNSDETHFFAVDNGGASASDRVTAQLPPGEMLCNVAGMPDVAFVSVFETADALEGCSRLVANGMVEGLVQYADFDRCEWSSHSG